MKHRDLFALGVRLFGIWLICRGVTGVASFVDGKLYPASEKSKDSTAAYLIYAVIDFALAAIFLLWTRAVVSWSYGEEVDTPRSPGDADSAA